MSQEKENFLDRWSRLKQEEAKEPAAPPAQKKEQESLPALPRIEDLKPDSDFTPFMDPRVDGETRRAALKKLFADQHFNVPDPFEAYSEDYTVEDPIPKEMLKKLKHARRLFFEEEKAPQPEVAEKKDASPPDAKDVAGKQDA